MRAYILVLVCACTKPLPVPSPHTELDVEKCLPVGYGLSCACTLHRDGGIERVSLHMCVGKNDGPEGLGARVSQAPIVGHDGPPVHMSIVTRPAKDDERYCGVIEIGGATYERITAFGP